MREGPLATFEEACLAHSYGYVQQIFEGSSSDTMRRRVGFAEAPMERYVLRALASLGASVQAVRQALEHGWSPEVKMSIVDDGYICCYICKQCSL